MTGPWDRYQRAERGPWERYGGGADADRIRGLSGWQGELGSFGSAAADSLSLGFGDELMGLGAGIAASARGDDFGTAAREQTERSRQRLRDAWRYHGGSALAGTLAGALPLGGAIGLAGRGARAAARLRNLSPTQRIASAGAWGGGVGAVYGAGSSEGDLSSAPGLINRGISAAQGAGLGALTGGALQGLGMGAGHMWRNVLSPSLSPEQRAAQELARAMNRSGVNTPQAFAQRADELAAMERVSPGSNPMVMDALEGAGTDLTMIAGARQSAGRQAMRDTLEARNEGARERVRTLLWRELGGGQRLNAARTLEDLEEIQRTEAAPLFAAAYRRQIGSVPQGLREFVAFNARTDARFYDALKTTRETMRRELGADATDAAMMQRPMFWHRLLENVSGEVGAAIRAARMTPLDGPRGTAIFDMTQDAQSLNRQVRALLGPEFNRAMNIYAGAARNMEAVQLGRSAVSAKGELELGQLSRQLNRMSRGEREQARFAAITALSDELAEAPLGGRADVLRRIIGNETKRNALQTIFGGEAAFGRVMRALDYERRLFLNYADTNIGRGSPTADKMQGGAQMFGMDGGGVFTRLRAAAGRESQQRYDEAMANEILDLMRTPLTGPNATRNPVELAERNGLLSRAMREAERQRTLRARAGPQARQMGALNAVGFAPYEVFGY